jgi:uncharacterized membrane protein YfcA
LDLDLFGWVVVAVCAVMVGTTKTGMPGLGILIVPLMVLVLPTRQSTGILLGILILADLFAITYHRRNARWGHVLRLLPAAFAGIVAGYFGLKFVNDRQLKPIIGGVVLVMLSVNYWDTMVVRRHARIHGGIYDDDGQRRRADHDYLSAGDAAAQGRICGNRSVFLFRCQLA